MFTEATLSRKQQIFSVAQNLFSERGFAGTSMRDIARQVGIEPASLYSHITSKEEILQEICFRIANEFFTEIEQVRGLNIPSDEKLKKAIVAHISVIKNNLDASHVFLHEWRFLSEPSYSIFKAQRKKYEQIFKEIIEAGQKENVFSDININIVLPTIFSAMNWTYEWHKPNASMDAEKTGEAIFSMIFKGIKA